MKNVIVTDSKSVNHAKAIAEKTGSQLQVLDDPEAMLSEDCSLIVIAAGSSRLYVNPDVLKVMTLSKCPVYVVRTQDVEIKSLLIPVDNKTIVGAKADLVKRLARVFDADITIIKIRDEAYRYVVDKLNVAMLRYVTRSHLKVRNYSTTQRNVVKYADKHDAVVLQGQPNTKVSASNYDTLIDTSSNVLYVKAKRGDYPF